MQGGRVGLRRFWEPGVIKVGWLGGFMKKTSEGPVREALELGVLTSRSEREQAAAETVEQ